MSTYTYTGSIQKLTVQNAGTYDITAYGAAGGGAAGHSGGAGAEVGGNFVLQAGEKLEIVVGGTGRYGIDAGGGGGGTFVLGNTGAGYTLLLAAGGGGGAAQGRGAGGAGSASLGSGADGVVGAGGAGGNYGGGGGSGYKGDGGTSQGGTGGDNRTGGYAGGVSLGGDAGKGGFGGGGGGTDDRSNDGGGGGGYSGGAGGGGAGGGGGSIDKGTAIAAQTRSSVNTGAGKVNVICYVTGTAIRVWRDGAAADVPVEQLTAGEAVVTATGHLSAVRWLGHSTVGCRAHPEPRKVWPIRIAADAFGRNRPSRDLYVSPEHSLCVEVVEEVLIPAQALLNGSTVAQIEMDEVTYWHVELESGHDILWADGMPAESFLEIGANRALLELASRDTAADDLSAEVLARTHADFCRPFHDAGPIVDIVRAQLASRAERLGWQPSREMALTAISDGTRLATQVVGGEAFVTIPDRTRDLRLRSRTHVPAQFGEADARRLGLAIYALTLVGAEDTVQTLDLDDPVLRDCFHKGERLASKHYRWTKGDLVIPSSHLAGVAGPLMLRVSFEPSTVRGWIEPEHRPQRPKLRIVS